MSEEVSSTEEAVSNCTINDSTSSSTGYLPINKWDAEKQFNRSDTVVSQSSDYYTYDEVVSNVEGRIQALLNRDDLTTAETRSDLKFIQRQTRYCADVSQSKQVVDRIEKLGITHVFLRTWQAFGRKECRAEADTDAFKSLQSILSIIWNCTDKCLQLCESLVNCGVIQQFFDELRHPDLQDSDLVCEEELYFVKAYLGICHNIVRLCPESRKIFRSAGAVAVLQCYLKKDQGLVKVKAYLILSYIITEHENELINANDENIALIVQILRETLASENHFSKTYAFWASEVACGINHLAVNDCNKVRICRLGAIPLYMKLLRSSNIDEQELGSNGIWILSFHDENKIMLKQEPGCIQVLQKLVNESACENIRRAARGALWVLQTTVGHSLNLRCRTESWSSVTSNCPLSTQTTELPHVMISYQHSDQRMMLKVKHYLAAAGYKVWMDVDDMKGSTLDSMAMAVEGSAVIIIGMSQAYKDSASCRTEAEYIYRQKKDIVPLLLQVGYAPDGWLGILVGTRLFFDFTGEERLDTSLPRLVRELGSRGRLLAAATDMALLQPSCSLVAPNSANAEGGDYVQPETSLLTMSSFHSYQTIAESVASQVDARSWLKEDVKVFLLQHRCAALIDKFCEYDGQLLVQLKKMYLSCPEYYYHALEHSLHLNLTDILRLSFALDRLDL